MPHAFRQVDVFGPGAGAEPLLGNPVAVVHDADDLSPETMAAFARWTNLSETTFLLRARDPGADYRLRIFTPGAELPFAGHPTLGSAHAWLEAGGEPSTPGRVVQECGAGLVVVRHGEDLAFAAPPLIRSGAVEPAYLDRVVRALRVDPSRVLEATWLDNGPGWVGLLLDGAATVLALEPDFSALEGLDVGVVGRHPDGAATDVEVRAFCPGLGVREDPVTGSLNAAIGQWLAGGVLPTAYVASQGTVLGRRGRVRVERVGEEVWVGGQTRTTITGHLDLA